MSQRINDRLHIQILKYTILLLLLLLLSFSSIYSLNFPYLPAGIQTLPSLPSANGSSKSPSASKALRTSSIDKHPLLAILLVSLFC